MKQRKQNPLNAIRAMEERLAYAPPEQAARLTAKIVEMKGKLFKNPP